MRLKPTSEIEVFVNEGGYVSVIQRASGVSDEDQIVQLSADQAELVAQELTRLLQQKAEWWSPIERDEDELERAQS